MIFLIFAIILFPSVGVILVAFGAFITGGTKVIEVLLPEDKKKTQAEQEADNATNAAADAAADAKMVHPGMVSARCVPEVAAWLAEKERQDKRGGDAAVIFGWIITIFLFVYYINYYATH
jgi:hypothetical protein